MRTTPGPGFESNGRLDAASAPIAWYVLVVVSFCAALVAFSLMFVTLRLNDEMVAANPYCFTPVGHVLQLIADIHASLLACGAAVVLSWFCTLFARRSAFGSTPEARRALLMLSALALIGFAFSFGVYYLSSYAGCFA